MPKKADPRRLCSSLTYTVLELASALDRNPETVRNWIKQGLRDLNNSRPTLVLGSDAKDFLAERQKAAKRPLNDDQLLCLTCKEPRRPFEGLVDLHGETRKPSRIVGFCQECTGICSCVVGKAQIAQLSKFFEVGFTKSTAPQRRHSPSIQINTSKGAKMPRKVNEEDERIKRSYLTFMKEAKRADEATVLKAAEAILRFEASTGYKPFKRFHIEQVRSFKTKLDSVKSKATGKPLSKAAINGILRACKAFFSGSLVSPATSRRSATRIRSTSTKAGRMPA